MNISHFIKKKNICTVDSRYLEFDGTMEKIRVNHSLTQEELRKYRKCSLLNDERETTRAKFWRAKTSIACHYSRNDFKHIFFSLLNSLNLVERLITSRYLFLHAWICLSAVVLSFNFTHHDIFFFVQYCLFTINCVFLLFNKV